MTVLFDIQGTQSRDHADRGIARYLRETAAALAREHPDVVSGYVLNPDLPPPRNFERLAALGRIRRSDGLVGASARIYHVGSPFERVPVDRLWPRAARGGRMRLAVTVYDLIPQLFPELYLSDPLVLRWYRARLELVRQADLVLAISQATASDVVSRLGVPPSRVEVVGAGVGAEFRPADAGAVDPVVAAVEAVDDLEPGYLLYTGGVEPRKNIDRLLAAFARLPGEVRDAHQLVIVCSVSPAERRRLSARLAELGINSRVLFPGYVDDRTLVALYRGCRLFVFPSLYEGFGLPVAEAQACGAPVVASATSSLVELVPKEGLFDPLDVGAIATAIRRALDDGELSERLRGGPRQSWTDVAAKTADAYARLAPPRARRGPRVAFVTPLPPQASGVANASYRLIEAFAKRCDLDVFIDGPSAVRPEDVRVPAGVTAAAVTSFARCDHIRDYDRVVYCMGNSEFHVGALSLLPTSPGIVIAHDLRLTGLYAWTARHRPDVLRGSFAASLRAMYGDTVPGALGEKGWIDLADADRFGIFMARDVIGASTRFLVHSAYTAQLARLEARPEDADKIGVLPFGVTTAPIAAERCGEQLLVATFGIATAAKQTEKVVHAFARLAQNAAGLRLAVVGSFPDPRERASAERLAAKLGIADRTLFTGRVDDDEYDRWLARATVAVQLRSFSNGETSAAVMDCAAAGVPTIVTGIGASSELPDAAVVKVSSDVGEGALAAELRSLLCDSERRAALSEAATAYARAHSFERAADALYDYVVETTAAGAAAA